MEQYDCRNCNWSGRNHSFVMSDPSDKRIQRTVRKNPVRSVCGGGHHPGFCGKRDTGIKSRD